VQKLLNTHVYWEEKSEVARCWMGGAQQGKSFSLNLPSPVKLKLRMNGNFSNTSQKKKNATMEIIG